MTIALILAGGTGSRLGADIPKQYLEFDNKPIISYCIDKFINHPMIDGIRIVADEMWHDYIMRYIPENNSIAFSLPGVNRQCSIFNGISDIREYCKDTDYVIIHDAARPLISAQVITECLNVAYEHDGALPVLPMKDTVYLSEDGKSVTKLIDREKVFAGQSPEAFVLGKYYIANKSLFPERILNINGSTEPAIIAGMDIKMINADENNFKITTKADLERFKEYIKMVKI